MAAGHVERRQRVADLPLARPLEDERLVARLGAARSPDGVGRRPSGSRSRRSRRRLRERRGQPVDLRARVHLGDGDEEPPASPPRRSARAARPPRIPRAARRASSRAASPGRLDEELVEGRRRSTGADSRAASRSRPSGTPPSRGSGAATSRRPSLPSSDMWMFEASAISPWFVQMLEVAFSRRMCCSRVESVRQKARRPSASCVSPTSRPGICRWCSVRQARKPRSGPPLCIGTPSDCASPHAMSAPPSPGGASRRERRRLGDDRDRQRALRRRGGPSRCFQSSTTP